MSDERGQAALFAVLLIAIAAVAIAGLRVAQEQLLARAIQHRAGEGAVEAATAVTADAYAAALRGDLIGPAGARGTRDIVRDPRIVEAARRAASDVSVRNGGPVITDLVVRCEAGAVAVSIVLSGVSYRAAFPADGCFPR